MPAPRRLARRLLRALVSAIALVALTCGLPWLLWTTTITVWAQGADAFEHLLSRQDTGAAFMLALCVIGWIAWASFILSLLLEIPAQLRGRQAPRLPGFRLSQRAVGSLVSGILLISVSSTVASAATTQATTGSADVSNPTTAVTPGPPAAKTPGASRPANKTYTVRATRPAESLWSIAERLYGRGELYTKIANANEGRRMPDGTVFHANAPIQPGWVLHLPDSPRTHTDDPARQTGKSYTMRQGDTLWQVAEDQLGNGERYEELFEANKGIRQPDGTLLSDPDKVQAGTTLTIPPASSPPETPTAPVAPPKASHPVGEGPAETGKPHAKPTATAPVAPPKASHPVGEGPAETGKPHAKPTATAPV
ncbi:LysM peptidoglycan-binding domain-containing protein, partial [Streptomyces sp. NPDC056549]|uniref:LysM peptidoglycan-binding domain-containing protein n=1 Tax=Streptomyces sp. NPDC056549 TaxID=3345864 RepID=UPI0036B535BA